MHPQNLAKKTFSGRFCKSRAALVDGTSRTVATATASAEVVEVDLPLHEGSHKTPFCKGPLGSAVGLLEQLRTAPVASARL